MDEADVPRVERPGVHLLVPESNVWSGLREGSEAVRQALKIYGVKETQMEAVSWGSEKPKAAGQNESAWAQNRRADLQYPKQ